MSELAVAMIYFLGLAFVPLLIPLTAAVLGSIGRRLKPSRTSLAQNAVDEARRRAELRRG